jgi:hypothetical protein
MLLMLILSIMSIVAVYTLLPSSPARSEVMEDLSLPVESPTRQSPRV